MLIKKRFGNILIILSLVITFILFVLSKNGFSVFINSPFLTLSQLFALFGAVLLSITFVLSSKAFFVEKIFEGLDRVYKTHHLVSIVSFLLLLNHPILLIINSLPNPKAALAYILPGSTISYNAGIFALWTLILLVVLTIYINLPYHIWKKTHEFMGLVILLGGIHIFLIPSDVASNMPLRFWMLGFIFIGLGFYLYSRVYKYIGPRYDYIVSNIEKRLDILDIYLKPVKNSLKFIPGQFAFISFNSPKISDEMHAFSMSSTPSDSLRFSIKILGDYTESLKNLESGAKAKVWGSYGSFPDRFFNGKDAVCVAGGIGITPFLSMLGYEAKSKNKKRKVYLFYSVSKKEELIYEKDILKMIKKNPNIKYFSNVTSEKGRLTGELVLKTAGSIDNKLIFLCGPVPMMKDLSAQFQQLGVKKHDIIFEDFSFK